MIRWAMHQKMYVIDFLVFIVLPPWGKYSDDS